jgi:hypothetical protein
LRPQSGNALSSILERALDVTGRGASGNIVQREHLRKPEAGVEARVEARMDRLQIGRWKLL